MVLQHPRVRLHPPLKLQPLQLNPPPQPRVRYLPKIMSDKNCESCANYLYDEEFDCYYCDINLDEDEMMRFLSHQTKGCPYYNHYDEYGVVRKQN